jgi:hypothetical protein
LFSFGITPVDPTLVPSDEAATKERVAALTEWRSQNVLGALREQKFQHAFQQWQQRWDQCVAAQGDYFKGDAAQT